VGSGGGLLYAAGGVPYTFQNGLAMFNPVPQAPQAAAATAAAFPDGYAVTALPQMVSHSLTFLLTFLKKGLCPTYWLFILTVLLSTWSYLSS